jgi:type VI secretion system protein
MRAPMFLQRLTGRASETDEPLDVSIQTHLVHLLNTRRYSVPHLPDYGLPDLHETYQGHQAAHDALADAIRTVLAKYEPRLRDVGVRRVADPEHKARLSFVIEGKITDGSRESTLIFQTQMLSDGRYTATRGTRYG